MPFPFGMASAPQYANTNALWGALGVRTLERLGLKHAVISPGSRSTPIAFALAQSKEIHVNVALDERSAGFIALGIAKATKRPVVLLCTSGTAAANYLPAVIEARLSCTPLIIVTADRPPELRDCHSGQTISQNGIFGIYPVWATEVAVPSTHISLLRYWRQTLVDAWQRALSPLKGPVHLNLPFRDPLDPAAAEKGFKQPAGFDLETFTDIPKALNPPTKISPLSALLPLPKTGHGVIIVGPHAEVIPEEFSAAILELSQLSGWPILADGAGTLRGDLADSGRLISTYDSILRNSSVAKKLKPKAAIIVGPLPTSKVLRKWLEEADVIAVQVNQPGENIDPTHSRWIRRDGKLVARGFEPVVAEASYLDTWNKYQSAALKKLAKITNVNWPFEGRIIKEIEESLTDDDRLVIGNSMPIRDLEWFYHPKKPGPEIIYNRGANGIDGTVSTAIGASMDGRHTVLLCGDLTFLHDSNALLSAKKHKGDLTVVVVNNNGGGIFNHLPVAAKNPHFEKLWGTPQDTNIGKLCAAHGVVHTHAKTWSTLNKLINQRERGVRVVEFTTNREKDAAHRIAGLRS